MIKAYSPEDLVGIERQQAAAEVPRASQPAGFTVTETWGGFLSQNVPEADDLFNLIDGVRLMIKFDEWENDPDQVALIVDRAEKAYNMGKRIHLDIDCFNTAQGPGDYHSSVNMPRLNKIAAVVRDIISAFPPLWKVEVFNEPYYCKNHSQRITILEYVDYVKKFIEGCDMARFRGYLVASQTSKEFWDWPHRDNKIENGWEWRPDCVWQHGGNLEGRHSAILHRENNSAGVINLIGGTWYQGRAIGWRHPIDETECSPVGINHSTDSQRGREMTKGVLRFMKTARCPLTILTWGAKYEGYGHPAWPGEMHYVNKHGRLSMGAHGIYEFYGEDPIDPPPPDTGGMGEIIRAERDLRVTKKNWDTGVGLRHAHRTIAHIQNAISQRD